LRDDALQALLGFSSLHDQVRRRRALAEIRKSLKHDKTLPESHAWVERLAVARGDSASAALGRRWRERAEP